jgi:hypothetical protein
MTFWAGHDCHRACPEIQQERVRLLRAWMVKVAKPVLSAAQELADKLLVWRCRAGL